MSHARNTGLALLALLPISAACVRADDSARASPSTVSVAESDEDGWQRAKKREEEDKAVREAAEARIQLANQAFLKHQAEQEAARAKEECSAPFMPKVRVHGATTTGLDGVADLRVLRSQAKREAADARDAIVQIRQCDPELADNLAPDVEAWIAQSELAIDGEETCRKTPACMAPRLVEPLCQAISDRRLASQSMARENRNPSGYVDRRVLYEFGQEIQNDDDTIRDLKAQYVALTHKPFIDATCPKTP
jgi:hypothetical protein